METDLEDEILALKKEALWILREEVKKCLQELLVILQVASSLMNSNIAQVASETVAPVKPQKFIMSSSSPYQSVKCVLTLEGDNISDLDLSFKLPKQTSPLIAKYYPDRPWRLQQLQDCGQFLSEALQCVENHLEQVFTSIGQAEQLFNSLFLCLEQGRCAVIKPRKRTVSDLVKSPVLSCLKPVLPSDVALSIYLHSQKLILCIYQINTNGNREREVAYRMQVDCTVPWLTELISCFSSALAVCQQLKDKIQTLKDLGLAEYYTPEESTEQLIDLSDTFGESLKQNQYSKATTVNAGINGQKQNEKPTTRKVSIKEADHLVHFSID